jgi:hypothetical protein
LRQLTAKDKSRATGASMTNSWHNPAQFMKWIHLVFGVVLFFVFTTTGSYMRADFPDKEAISQELMRSRHIYILFSALIHLALGVYLAVHAETWRRIVQLAGSGMLFASSVYLVWAFITETYTLQHFSDLSRNGIYMSLAGVVLHLLGGIRRR